MNNVVTFKTLMQVNSEAELRKLGKIKKPGKTRAYGVNGLREIIQNGLSVSKISLKGSSSYKSLFAFINQLKQIPPHVEKASKPETQVEYEDLYFESEAAKMIYALVELKGGDVRLNQLGVEDHFYSDENAAKKWRDEVSRIIHPDVCDHPNANLAFSRLNDLYEIIIGK